MAKVSPGGKKKKAKAGKAAPSKDKSRTKAKSGTKTTTRAAAAKKPAVKTAKAVKTKRPAARTAKSAKSKRPAAPAKRKKAAAKPGKKTLKGKKKMAVEQIKRLVLEESAPEPEQPPRLLSESKSTVAALGQLEKAMKLIHQRDFSKANAELQTLIENYPGEPEICAAARRYQKICERENRKPRKTPASSDHAYSLGIMEHNRGAYDKAIAIFRDLLEKQRMADHIHYSIAASYARKGSFGEAIASLKRAIELNSDNRVYAKNESDFSSLHKSRDFADLVGMKPIENGES